MPRSSKQAVMDEMDGIYQVLWEFTMYFDEDSDDDSESAVWSGPTAATAPEAKALALTHLHTLRAMVANKEVALPSEDEIPLDHPIEIPLTADKADEPLLVAWLSGSDYQKAIDDGIREAINQIDELISLTNAV